jgi:hypothetical protein
MVMHHEAPATRLDHLGEQGGPALPCHLGDLGATLGRIDQTTQLGQWQRSPIVTSILLGVETLHTSEHPLPGPSAKIEPVAESPRRGATVVARLK